MLGQGHTLRLLDEARDVGRHQHPGPENQDSQHMIDKPRGSFPEDLLCLVEKRQPAGAGFCGQVWAGSPYS